MSSSCMLWKKKLEPKPLSGCYEMGFWKTHLQNALETSLENLTCCHFHLLSSLQTFSHSFSWLSPTSLLQLNHLNFPSEITGPGWEDI